MSTFEFTGTEVEFPIPPGTECIEIEAWGGRGGRASGGGSLAGHVRATFSVSSLSSSTLFVFVGQNGSTNAGGFGNFAVNGGAGYQGGGAGSYVSETSFTNTDACLIVAGGGGGDGWRGLDSADYAGGMSGGLNGMDGSDARFGVQGGKGSTGPSNGPGGIGTIPGTSGVAGNGGAGGAPSLDPFAGGGGGGGGGYRGAGGGGGGSSTGEQSIGGGGGGSNSFIDLTKLCPDTETINESGFLPDTENGRVIITTFAAPCLAEGAMVKLANDIEVPIERLGRGSMLAGSVRVEQLIRFRLPVRDFVRIETNAISVHCPSKPLLIREGHPMLIRGQELLPETLVDLMPGRVGRIHLEKPKLIYTIVTDKRTFADIQGVLISTWSTKAWNEQVQQGKILAFDSV